MCWLAFVWFLVIFCGFDEDEKSTFFDEKVCFSNVKAFFELRFLLISV